jgi:pyruvate,orthophosphate dikinase
VIAVDMVNDSLIDTQTALGRLESYDLEKVERRIAVSSSRSGTKNNKDIQTTKNTEMLAYGVPASPGIAIGKIVLDSKKAKEIAMTGKPTILIRTEISTDDISGMDLSEGVLTKVGGKTSHAALVSRQMNKVGIVGCQRLSIDLKSRKCNIGKEILYEGDYVSLDGNMGIIYQGKVEFRIEKPEQLLSEVKQWNRPQRKIL